MSDLPDTVDTDRRELWWLENFLAVNATTPRQRERQRLLREYLDRTCVHEFTDVSGWGGSPAGTYQCRWCSHAAFPDDPDYRDLLDAARLRKEAR